MGKAAGVSRRRRKVAQTKFKKKSTLKKQRSRQLREVKPLDPDVRANWDKKKSTTANMQSMGLVSDVNKILPIEKSYRKLGLPDPDSLMQEPEVDEMELLMQLGKKKKPDHGPEKGHVVAAMEEEALRPQEKRFKFSDNMSKFIVYMMEKHGCDFDGMAMDSRNRSQFSAAQIRTLIKKFMSIPGNRRAYERAVADFAASLE